MEKCSEYKVSTFFNWRRPTVRRIMSNMQISLDEFNSEAYDKYIEEHNSFVREDKVETQRVKTRLKKFGGRVELMISSPVTKPCDRQTTLDEFGIMLD